MPGKAIRSYLFSTERRQTPRKGHVSGGSKVSAIVTRLAVILIFLDSHFFDKAAQTLIVLGLTDRTGGKECVEQFLLTTEQLQLLFSRG